MSDRPFVGKTAVVTGGGRGIGRAIAMGLAARGASVVVASRTASQIEGVRTEIEQRGGTAAAIVADLGDADEVDRLVSETNATFGPVEILVNNAAVVAPIGPSRSIGPDEWAAALTLNVTAVARLSFSVLGEMLDRAWGRIINVSSGIAARPETMHRANAYATSKAALEAHTVNLAAELDGTGVTVNAYRPGGVDTAMQAWIREQPPEIVGEDLHDRFVASKRGGKLLTPEESADGLLPRIEGDATGQIWSVSDPL